MQMLIVKVSLLLKTSTGREAYSWGCFLFTILDYWERSGKLSDKLGAGYINCITNNWKHNQMNVSAYITHKCNINYRMDKYF
jgi:F0F1-type ATP synthase alpha subunit